MLQICGMQLNKKQATDGSRNFSSNQQSQIGDFLKKLLFDSLLIGRSTKTVSTFLLSPSLLLRDLRFRPNSDLLEVIQVSLILLIMKFPEVVTNPIVNN